MDCVRNLAKVGGGFMSEIRLVTLLDHSHYLYRLTGLIDWVHLEQKMGSTYADGPGRPETPVRLIVGLHYLKYLENKSDEEIVEGFVQNPYWQYFCGCEYFVHEVPIHPTTLVKWRKKIGIDKLETILKETIKVAKREQFISNSDLKILNVDTTVQEKAVTFPTDAKLYHHMRRVLVKQSHKNHVRLRQSYERVGQRAFIMQSRYAHARQMKRCRAQIKKLKTYLGRTVRDIERKCQAPHETLKRFLLIAKRILAQKRQDSDKVYSIHAPETECIAKGKAHKKYEFGCKVSVVTTSLKNWIVGIHAVHHNPYDGHTLSSSIDQVERLADQRPQQVFVDRGYRGHTNVPKDVDVMIAGNKKRVSPTLKKYFKRRSAIEPVIGHLKYDHRMNRNFLLGQLGDKINAIMSGSAFNLKKIINILKNQPLLQSS
jgi:IS5 family transposase